MGGSKWDHDGVVVWDGEGGRYERMGVIKERGRDRELEEEIEQLKEITRNEGGTVGIEVAENKTGTKGGGGMWFVNGKDLQDWYEVFLNTKRLPGPGVHTELEKIVHWMDGIEGYTIVGARVSARDEEMVEYRGIFRVGDVRKEMDGKMKGGGWAEIRPMKWGREGEKEEIDFLGHEGGMRGEGERGEARGWKRIELEDDGVWRGWRDDGTE